MGTSKRLAACMALVLSSGVTAQSTGTPSAGGTDRITLLTYNVLADEVLVEKRVPALLAILKESDADVIALQEVAPWFLERLLAEEWVAKAYGVSKIGGEPVAPGGQFILSKFPIEQSSWKLLLGPQRRTVLVSLLRVGDRRMAVATTHMDSPLEAHAVRADQLSAIFPLIRDADDAVLMGDFNFGDGEEPETSRLDKGYADLWIDLRAGEKGYTWDIEASDMAREGSFPGEKSRRLDRILIRSPIWKPSSIRIIGDRPITAGDRSLFPSDHFGLTGSVVRE